MSLAPVTKLVHVTPEPTVYLESKVNTNRSCFHRSVEIVKLNSSETELWLMEFELELAWLTPKVEMVPGFPVIPTEPNTLLIS